MSNPKEMDFKLAIKPGDHLVVYLRDNGLTRREFAKMSRVPIKYIRDLIAGKTQMTAEAAIRFEKVLGVSAELWMRFEMRYQLKLAYEAENRATRKSRKKSERSAPVSIVVVQNEASLGI